MRKISASWLLISAISAAPAAVAQDVMSNQDLVRELHVIGEGTTRAVSLLEQMLDQRMAENQLRRLQVAVLALQLRTTAIGDIEARIQTLQDRAGEAREYTTQLESELRRIDDLITAETTQEQEKAGLVSSREMVERQIELGQQRAWSLERQVLDLENELAAKRRDVENLEEIVMDGLSDF